MYSVLIQNQRTMDLFNDFQPLFSEALNDDRIGVCKWFENGTTIDTALPEIRDLTDDKEEWRAIIVNVVDDNGVSSFSSSAINPFDFDINKLPDDGEDHDNDPVIESPVPLIRLTHMLGGFPEFDVRYETKVKHEHGKADRDIYVVKDCPVREATHEKLVRKYRYSGKAPSSIILVTVREKLEENRHTLSKHWLNHMESDADEFWKRNMYPHICRFLVFDKEDSGPVQKDADDFRFWSSVALLATNDIDAGVLQAYRLYNLNARINRSNMEEFLQNYTDRLRDAKRAFEYQIKSDIKNMVSKEETLPEDIEIKVPVAIKVPKIDDIEIKSKSLPFLADSSNMDIRVWNERTSRAETNMAKAVKEAERTLDRTVNRMRSSLEYDKDAVEPLNKYQEEDLSDLISKIYANIVDVQGQLPSKDINEDKELNRTSENVREFLKSRITKSAAGFTLSVVAGLMVLSFIPAIIYFFVDKRGFPEVVGLTFLCSLLFVALCAFIVVLIQKLKLKELLKAYNEQLKLKINKMMGNASIYSEYISSIASHTRGKTYLEHSSNIKTLGDDVHSTKYKHITAINALLNKVKKWNNAYHLKVDFAAARPNYMIEVDSSVKPSENRLYQFDFGKTYSVEINDSGMNIEAPFNFVSNLDIEREELYG